MKIGITKRLRRVLVTLTLLFGCWWFLQSWVAYRHVMPSVSFTRDAVAFSIRQTPPTELTETEILHDAWRRGTLDMNRYLVGHFWIVVACMIIISLLALLPENKKISESSNNQQHPYSETRGGSPQG